MPRYDYQCEAGHRYEVTEPFGSPSTQACQKCGKPARRLLSAPAIVFKGSGWYSTDSGRTLRPGVGTEKDADSSDTSSDGATEDAPAAKRPAAKAKTTKASDKPKATADD